ncbi:MAG: choice-of-anchor P family protein [Streptosporangiaceae bacterium]
MKTLTAVLAAAALTAMPVAAHAKTKRMLYGSAYGLSAEGLIAVAPTPWVVSTTEDTVTKSLVTVPANPLLRGTVNNATASLARASASVVDVAVIALGLQASAIKASCDGGVGGASLADVRLGGQQIPLYPPVNFALNVPLGSLGGAEVTLNRQVRNRDGSLTVTAVHVNVVLAGATTQSIDIAKVTCFRAQAAPAPDFVPGTLPVTG